MRPAPGPAAADYETRRIEPAAFPLLGGSSDIGFQMGAVGTLTRFARGTRPYAWKMDLVASLSVKGAPDGGAEVAQQSYGWKWDVPDAAGGRLRLNPYVAYTRTINEGYFGLGNGTAGAPPGGGPPGRYFEWILGQALARELARVQIAGPWAAMFGTTFRVVDPTTYAGSKLAQDVAAGQVVGARTTGLATLAAGAIYDSRDDEIFPTRGQYHQVGVRAVQTFPLEDGARYAAVGAILAGYVPLARDWVVALRGVLDAELGTVPFYDLLTAGPFVSYEMPGGSSGVRGVPIGRYLGPLKAVANAELRALPARVRILGRAFRLGGDAFVDAGRVWSDLSWSSPRDGAGLGLKWGAGLGGYLLWGQAAMFRVEVAYSPDASAANPSLPLGVYVEDGVMF